MFIDSLTLPGTSPSGPPPPPGSGQWPFGGRVLYRWRAMRGRNRLRAFPRSFGALTMFMPIEEDSSQRTFTTPRRNGPWPVHGRNQDCRVRLHASTPPRGDSTFTRVAPKGSFSNVTPRRVAVAREGAPLSPFAPCTISHIAS
jgi:hypothetical protein